MANEFKVKKGLIVQGSGSSGDNTILDVQGNQGQLFSITDSLEGTLFSVSDISGIPILDVNSNEIVKIGTFGSEGIIVNGSNVTASAHISASGTITANAFVGDGSGITGISGFVDISGTPVDNDFAKFTDANTIEGRSKSEVLADLDLEIGTDVQAYDAQLAAIAGLATTDSGVIVGNGSTFVLETGATLRTSLGLGNVENTALSTYTGEDGALDNQYITNGAGFTTNTGTVTGVTSGDSNTITIGGTSAAPTVAANTAAVSNGGSNLATGDQIYDHVTTRISGLTSNTGTVDTTGTVNANEFARFNDSNTLEALTVAETKTALSLNNVPNSDHTAQGYATTTQLNASSSTLQTNIDAKHDTIDSGNRLNANLIGSNGNISNTEYGYLNGVTSAIQTQLDAKQASLTFGIGNGNVGKFNANVADNDFLRIDGTAIEGRSAAEMISDLGIEAGANNYSHPTFNGDDISIDTGALTGATVISDLDFNVTTNSEGHVTDANGTVSTRTLTASDLSLGNVTNESKATMFTNAALTGNPTAPTQTANDNSTKIATTAYVQTELTDLIGTAPAALDTLGELSASLASDQTGLASLTTTVSGKLAKSSNLSDLTNASTARTNLDVDQAGTDNSTPVTLAGSLDYITISGQEITRNAIDLANDVTGVLPSANLDSDTAHLSGTQTFSGAKTFSSLTSFTMDGNTISGINDSGEFTNNDSHIMTSAAIEDKIASDIAGKQDSLTFGIGTGNVVKFASDASDADFVKISGTEAVGRSASEVLSDIGGQAALTFGKSSGNALKSEEALTTNDILLMGSSHVKGRTYAELKSDLSLNNVENTAVSTFAGSSNITTVGTIGTGTWQGSVIASAYLDSDTAHLTTDQTFSGNKTFSAPITASGNISSSGTITANVLTANAITFPQDTNITISTPAEDSGNGDGGNLTIGSGNGAGSNGDGGDVTIQTGNGSGAGHSGDLTLATGTGTTAGTIILDSAGDIELNADGADIILKDATQEFGRFKRDSSDFVIKSSDNDQDLIFKGVDNSATITALTLDMSDAGTAYFNNHVSASGNVTGVTGSFQALVGDTSQGTSLEVDGPITGSIIKSTNDSGFVGTPLIIHQFMAYLPSFTAGNFYYGHNTYGPYHHVWTNNLSSEPTDMSGLGAARHAHFMHIVPVNMKNISLKGTVQASNTGADTVSVKVYKTTRSNSAVSTNSTLTLLGTATSENIDNVNHCFNMDMSSTSTVNAGEAIVLLMIPTGTSCAIRANWTLYGYTNGI